MTIAPVAHAHTHLGQHMCVGTVNIRKTTQESISGGRKQVRGQDKKKRRPKRCGRCIKFKGDHAMECDGRRGRVHCEYFEEDGTAKDSSCK